MPRVRKSAQVLKTFGLIVLASVLGLVSYVWYAMTIGSTLGLEGKLQSLDNVVSVEDYYVYEGLAFFTLILTEDRLIELSGIENEDLVRSDNMGIDRVGAYEVVCSYSLGGSSNAIYTKYLSDDRIVAKATENIPSLIRHYDELEELFSRMPLEFSSEASNDTGTPAETIVCRDASAELKGKIGK